MTNTQTFNLFERGNREATIEEFTGTTEEAQAEDPIFDAVCNGIYSTAKDKVAAMINKIKENTDIAL